KANLGASLHAELLANPKVLMLGAGFAALLGIIPGLPMIPFFVIAAILCSIAGARKGYLKRVESGDTTTTLGRQKALASQIDNRVKAAKAQRALVDNLAPTVVPISIDLDPKLTEALGFNSGDRSSVHGGALVTSPYREAFERLGARLIDQ